MTSTTDVTRRLAQNAARKLLSEILSSPTGRIGFSSHARDEMRDDDLTEVDVVNVLRGGRILEPAEQVGGTWRYRVHTDLICVVVAFRSTSAATVVTTFRKQRGGR